MSNCFFPPVDKLIIRRNATPAYYYDKLVGWNCPFCGNIWPKDTLKIKDDKITLVDIYTCPKCNSIVDFKNKKEKSHVVIYTWDYYEDYKDINKENILLKVMISQVNQFISGRNITFVGHPEDQN